MKICFVGPANSAHIVKWCKWFAEHGYEVHVISFSKGIIDKVNVHLIDLGVDANGSDFGKIRYLFTGQRIKNIIKEIRPDVINAHYASSYGMAMALSGVDKYIVSVWGSDVYDFPNKSIFHRALIKYSLQKANTLFSTSQAMADEASKYTKKKFYITPFGVDTELFNPQKKTRKSDNMFVIGTVKKLTDKYGIRNILEATSIIHKEKEIPVLLRIAGKGAQEEEYRQLAKELGIEEITSWLGFISQEQAAVEWANMDVALIPSTLESESFGVSAVEAQACGTPVIISDIPGLMESTSPNNTSIVVRRNDSRALAEAIIYLFYHSNMRHAMGKKGRKYVEERYSIDVCFNKIESLLRMNIREHQKDM